MMSRRKRKQPRMISVFVPDDVGESLDRPPCVPIARDRESRSPASAATVVVVVVVVVVVPELDDSDDGGAGWWRSFRTIFQDMDLIEVLWKQDVDLGFTLIELPATAKGTDAPSEKESEDDIEKLKALEAINAANDKKEDEVEEEQPKDDDDPWAGLSYTVDLETGEYILDSESSGSPECLAELEEEEEAAKEREEQRRPGASARRRRRLRRRQQQQQQQQQQLLAEASLNALVGLGDNSLGLNDASLGLGNDDFPAELLGDGSSLLDGCAAVDGFLANDTLGLPDGFNLEEALQLVGLDEDELERPEVKKKKDEEPGEPASESSAYAEDAESGVSRGPSSATPSANEAAASATADGMIHTPQYHHPHHPHHRSFQSRVPFVRTVGMDHHQRWPDIAPFFAVGGGVGGGGSGAGIGAGVGANGSSGALVGGEHFAHPGHHHHHHHHPGYATLGGAPLPHHHHHHHHGHYEAQRNVLLHNATLAPPVGDLNSTGAYHNTGGPSNLGSAVATSMNLTNSSEPMGPDAGAGYKTEPNEMMYYPNATNDTINQTTDSIFSALLDEQLGWNSEDLAFNVNDGLYGGASGATTGATATLPGVQSAGASGGGVAGVLATGAAGGGLVQRGGPGAAGATSLALVADERMDASSDSAVSSMGSERVPSLSDGEWMETGSNSSHTQADSHYSMDYTGKYRMPYDCGYALPGAGRPANGQHQHHQHHHHGQQQQQQQPHPRGCPTDRVGGGAAGAMTPVAQKKHHMFGKRCFQEQSPMPGAASTGPAVSPLASSATAHHPAAATPLKYDYEAAQTVAAAPPGQAYSGPIEGAAGPGQAEIKYSCSVDFSRHQAAAARSSIEQIHHNHTYHLPPENTGALQRPLSRDKKVRKSEGEEHLTRDEKRARALNVPIPVSDIINLPMDEFNERLSKYDLSEAQLSLIRDIRRRGKNKVAAQNCRKRKLDQINSLSDEVKEMRNRKMRLISERNYMLQEVARVKEKFGQLYRHIFHSLRDPEGHPYNTMEYSLQLSADGNVVLVPRSNTEKPIGK